MNRIFIDSLYFVAIFQGNDQWHQTAIDARKKIADRNFVTTDSVLSEVLNYFAGYNEKVRLGASVLVRDVLSESQFEVVEQTRSVLLNGLKLYESRLDKGYSLTDCISMNVCRELGIKEILTHDGHFEQEGFKILL